MALLSIREIERLAPLLEPLEKQEPVLCAWRYHCSSEKMPFRTRIASRYRRIARTYIDRKRGIKRPKEGQVVIQLLRTSPSTSGNLIPVMKELNSRGTPPFLIINRHTEGLLNLDLHSGHCSVNDILSCAESSREKKEINDQAIEYAESMRNMAGSELFEDAEDWISVGLASSRFGGDLFRNASFILGDSDLAAFDKGFFLSCERAGIPSAIVQHGFFDMRQFPIHARYDFDWGPYFSRKARSCGHPAERSVSTGCPRFDDLEKYGTFGDHDDLGKKYGSLKKPLVLAVSGVHAVHLYPSSINAFFNSLNALIDNGISVLIRQHPVEKGTGIYRDKLGMDRFEKCVFMDPSEDLYSAMKICDIVYLAISAAALEAMLLGVPVLWEDVKEGNPFSDIPLLGGGMYVNEKEIAGTVQEIGREGKARKEFLARQEEFLCSAISNRGRAAASIVDRIVSSKKGTY
ncbi:MAG TPA: hypothetical protein PKJ37_06990 [Acidobacteriota bacterium]|nr:hypothetical protein [Acidobacteriota bacterium]HNT17622.1 hypothetical protein [Acidobacteriota bacterium]